MPAFDVVKVWEAPADGTIKINNTIQLTDPSKEALVSIEMNKYIPPPLYCYTTSFTAPSANQTVYHYYEYNTSGTTYQNDNLCNGGVPLNKCIPSYYSKLNSVVINGQTLMRQITCIMLMAILMALLIYVRQLH